MLNNYQKAISFTQEAITQEATRLDLYGHSQPKIYFS